VSKVLSTHPVRAHKLEYSPERRESGFGVKMMEILPVYLEVSVRRTNHPHGWGAVAEAELRRRGCATRRHEASRAGWTRPRKLSFPLGGTEYENRLIPNV
jgi:hypothetical protein